MSLIMLVLGVGLATAGDYDYTLTGLSVTVLGVVLAAVKTVATNRLMTGPLALSATEVLLRLSPVAAMQCMTYAILFGEVESLRMVFADGHFSRFFMMALLANGGLALLLNIVSLQTNKMAGAVTLTVCGNVKQALTIGLGIVLFDLRMSFTHAAGLAITVLGAVWYSMVDSDKTKCKTRG